MPTTTWAYSRNPARTRSVRSGSLRARRSLVTSGLVRSARVRARRLLRPHPARKRRRRCGPTAEGALLAPDVGLGEGGVLGVLREQVGVAAVDQLSEDGGELLLEGGDAVRA